MLLGNGTYLNANAGRLFGGGNAAPISQGNYQKAGARRGVALPDGATAALELIGYPTGYSGEGWFMPITGGDLTSLYNTDFSLTVTAPILDGRPMTAISAEIGIDTNTPAMLPSDTASPLRTVDLTFGLTTVATGGLVVTVAAGEAPATFGFNTNTPLMTASLGGEGTATFGLVTEAELIALGIAAGDAPFGLTVAWDGYAIGEMEGTTAESGVTIDNIVAGVWSALAADFNAAGTMGEKLNGAGSAGNPWTEIIEGGLSAAEILRIVAASLAGEVSGAGTGTEIFKGLDGTTDRITSSPDVAGNRTVVLDGS
jgi:hypothetical protein